MLRTQLVEVTSRIDADISVAEDQLAIATKNADQSARRLLTEQGDTLKNEVAAALRDLGFTVHDSDTERAEAGQMLMDDLLVSIDKWVAVVEVKGYAKGAKTSDLLRMARAVKNYEQRAGRECDARWYIVNQHRDIDPETRPIVLQGADEDIAEFAENNGLAIDARELFKMRRDLVEDRFEKSAAMHIIMTGRVASYGGIPFNLGHVQ